MRVLVQVSKFVPDLLKCSYIIHTVSPPSRPKCSVCRSLSCWLLPWQQKVKYKQCRGKLVSSKQGRNGCGHVSSGVGWGGWHVHTFPQPWRTEADHNAEIGSSHGSRVVPIPYIYVRMYIVTSVYLGGCVHSWVSPSLMNYVILSVIIVWGNSVCTCVEFRTLSIELPIDSSSEFFQGLNQGLQIRMYVGSC